MTGVLDDDMRPLPPVPSSVSEQAQQFLATTSAFGSVAAPPQDPSDIDGWLQYVEVADEMLTQVFKARVPADLPLQRSAFELSGVRTYVLDRQACQTGPIRRSFSTSTVVASSWAAERRASP
jgi:hypothetical protein